MVVRSKGLRSKSRHILRKHPRARGNPPPSHALRRFEEGSSVAIVIDSSVHGGMPHVRFQGQTGVVIGRQGDAVRVQVVIGKKPKELVVRPEHLKPVS